MSSEPEGPVTIDADALLGTRSVEAGVAALAARNQHHLAGMGADEQAEAVEHWRELAVEVLSAARVALADAAALPGAGRAVIVLEDSGGDEVSVHVTFAPQLEEMADGSIAGTPAQLAAMSLLEAMTAEDHGGHDHDHGGHGHEH
ncbi:hypothetical protein FSW04_02680 [Baekduia soli]|uniref:Uncharacterized protein n=1 Tax=Baekduia soli TaxID=496014 RepID=A0A5B8U0Z3_9ACTN|nr:hypothetical protein [Baekduia soli]QEC46592.1 hypothetical protein FSW04_02680 [Baekduia soli]